jgi:hypothetical protein
MGMPSISGRKAGTRGRKRSTLGMSPPPTGLPVPAPSPFVSSVPFRFRSSVPSGFGFGRQPYHPSRALKSLNRNPRVERLALTGRRRRAKGSSGPAFVAQAAV